MSAERMLAHLMERHERVNDGWICFIWLCNKVRSQNGRLTNRHVIVCDGCRVMAGWVKYGWVNVKG